MAPSTGAPPRRGRKHPDDELLPPGKLAVYGMQHVLAFHAGADQQRELMRHYPALGAEAVAEGDSGEMSLRDQASVGLTRLADEDFAAFRELTADYERKFGFPLIVCVRDMHGRAQIPRQGRARLHNSRAQDHAAALIEIAKIAGHRFDELVAEANPIHTARNQRYENLR